MLNAKPELGEGVGLFWESKCHFAHITLSLCCHGEATGNSDPVPANPSTQTHINTLFLTSSDLASRCSSCLKCHRYAVTAAASANSSRSSGPLALWPSAPHRKPSSLKRHPQSGFFFPFCTDISRLSKPSTEKARLTKHSTTACVVCVCPPAGGGAVPRRPRQMRPRAGAM